MSTRTDRHQVYADGVLVHEDVQVVDTTEETNEAALTGQVDQALDGLRTLANSSGTLTAAQLSNGVRLCARCLIGIIRLLRRRFDATD